MRKIHLAFFSTFVSLFVISCGGISTSLSPGADAPKWIPDEVFYQTDGSCERGDLVFKVLVAAGTKLWTDPQQLLVGQSELFVNKNGTYSVRYREFESPMGVVSFDTRFSGNYQVQQDTGEIYFENLGYGNILTRQGKYFLEFQYSVNINSAELKGKSARFRLVGALTGLNTDRAQYCNYAP